jgi:hypothetical protein
MTARARWGAFLSQIEARHRAVRQDALNAAAALMDQIVGTDTQPISQSFAPMEARMQDLERRIADTWHEKVVDALVDEEGGDAGLVAEVYDEGDEMCWSLENARTQLEQHIYADLARRLFARGLFEWRGRFCYECGAALSPPICARALELRCVNCGQATIFEPGELMRGVAAIGAHALSFEQAQPEWLAMRAAERRVRRRRPPCPLPLLKEYERTQIAYWYTYIQARAQLEPELGRDVALEVRSRMEQWYRDRAEYEPEWVHGGRPRERL